eukprot:s964_g21.t1
MLYSNFVTVAIFSRDFKRIYTSTCVDYQLLSATKSTTFRFDAGCVDRQAPWSSLGLQRRDYPDQAVFGQCIFRGLLETVVAICIKVAVGRGNSTCSQRKDPAQPDCWLFQRATHIRNNPQIRDLLTYFYLRLHPVSEKPHSTRAQVSSFVFSLGTCVHLCTMTAGIGSAVPRYNQPHGPALYIQHGAGQGIRFTPMQSST